MLIKNIFIENSKTASDIRVEDGIFKTIAPSLEALPGEEVIDCTGKSAFPPFIESHVHLDTCLTAGDPVWNMSGTLFEGIECWSKRKEKLSKEDVKDRARRAIKMQASMVFNMYVLMWMLQILLLLQWKVCWNLKKNLKIL